MIAALKRPFGIDQYVGDILDVPDLVYAAAYFEQRIVARRAGIGGIEQQAVREAGPPTSGQLPVLALDVMDDRLAGPAEQRGHHEAHALARAGRSERHDMLRAIVTQIVVADEAEGDAILPEQAGSGHILACRPAR